MFYSSILKIEKIFWNEKFSTCVIPAQEVNLAFRKRERERHATPFLAGSRVHGGYDYYSQARVGKLAPAENWLPEYFLPVLTRY